MKRFWIFIISFAAAVTVAAVSPWVTADGYYNRGTVAITMLGSSSVTVEAGRSANISIDFSPQSYTGNVGCGMAECPQICGGLCGDEVTGQCACAGGEQQTAYTNLSIAVANAAVASASYKNGVITVNGKSPGSTILTLTATLWQHTNSSPETIKVTVTNPAPVTPSPSSSPQPSPSGTSSSAGSSSAVSDPAGPGAADSSDFTNPAGQASNPGIPVVTPYGSYGASPGDSSGIDTAEPGSLHNASASTSGGTAELVTPMHGKIQLVTLTGAGPTGKSEMEKAKAENRRLTFQKLDESQNVLYSWTFPGECITEPADIDMNISMDTSAPAGFGKSGLRQPFYFSFSHHGPLPGKADIFMNVGGAYAGGDALALYYLDPEQGPVLVQKSLAVSAGYVTFSIDHCSDYAIAIDTEEDKGFSGLPAPWIAGGAVLAAAAAAFFLLTARRRKKSPAGV